MNNFTKKVSALLIVCLTTISQLYSQTPSNNCVVPCVTLKNAIKVKYELDFAYNRIGLLKDSIQNLQTTINKQDTIIQNKTAEIKNLNTDLVASQGQTKEEKKRGDVYQNEVDRQKRNKWIAIVAGSVTTLLSLIFF